jgi:hypothetical protein
MNKNIFYVFTLLLLKTAVVFSCDENGKTGFLPANNLKISIWDKSSNGITEDKFLSIIKKVTDIYAPIVQSKGGNLVLNNEWSDDTVNALAIRNGDSWVINMYGGLARHKLTTEDGLALIVCHEIGHHIGGAPHKNFSWAASEGQADYFGAMKCLRRVFESDDNLSFVSKITVEPLVTNQCSLVYKSADGLALCQRIAMAGKSLGSLLASLTDNLVDFNRPDLTKVITSFEGHPAAQCRLDTFFQGILCDKSYDQDIDNKDPIIGSCIASDGHQIGIRPRCWYKPGPVEI